MTRTARILLLIAALAVAASSAVSAGAAAAPAEWRAGAEVLGLTLLWVIAAAAVFAWGRVDPLSTMGFKRGRWPDVLIGIGAGIVLMLAVPLLAMLASAIAGDTGLIETAAARPAWLVLLGVLTASGTEEIVYRGAAMGALQRAGAGWGWQLLLPAAAFTATHLSWSPAHTLVVVLPLALALGALYLWRRSLVVTVIAHLVIDAPLVAIALMS